MTNEKTKFSPGDLVGFSDGFDPPYLYVGIILSVSSDEKFNVLIHWLNLTNPHAIKVRWHYWSEEFSVLSKGEKIS